MLCRLVGTLLTSHSPAAELSYLFIVILGVYTSNGSCTVHCRLVVRKVRGIGGYSLSYGLHNCMD